MKGRVDSSCFSTLEHSWALFQEHPLRTMTFKKYSTAMIVFKVVGDLERSQQGNFSVVIYTVLLYGFLFVLFKLHHFSSKVFLLNFYCCKNYCDTNNVEGKAYTSVSPFFLV